MLGLGAAGNTAKQGGLYRHSTSAHHMSGQLRVEKLDVQGAKVNELSFDDGSKINSATLLMYFRSGLCRLKLRNYYEGNLDWYQLTADYTTSSGAPIGNIHNVNEVSFNGNFFTHGFTYVWWGSFVKAGYDKVQFQVDSNDMCDVLFNGVSIIARPNNASTLSTTSSAIEVTNDLTKIKILFGYEGVSDDVNMVFKWKARDAASQVWTSYSTSLPGTNFVCPYTGPD